LKALVKLNLAGSKVWGEGKRGVEVTAARTAARAAGDQHVLLPLAWSVTHAWPILSTSCSTSATGKHTSNSHYCVSGPSTPPPPHLHHLVHPELSGALLAVAALIQLSHKPVLPRHHLGGAGRHVIPAAVSNNSTAATAGAGQSEQIRCARAVPKNPAQASCVPGQLPRYDVPSCTTCTGVVMCCPCITPLQLPAAGQLSYQAVACCSIGIQSLAGHGSSPAAADAMHALSVRYEGKLLYYNSASCGVSLLTLLHNRQMPHQLAPASSHC
jgi:hypothetical protein